MSLVTLIDPVGIGGFGTVWRARDQFGREVAAKIIDDEMLDIADVRLHAFALAQVTHPAVVRLYSVETARLPGDPEDEVECVVMELISGTTLEARLKGPPLLWHQVVRIGRDLCAGLEAIHTANIIHGDLGTCNVMLRKGGRAQIIDLLYRGTLAALTPRQLGDRVREDVRNLGEMLTEILAQSVLGAPAAERFAREEAGHASLWWTRDVFRRIVGEFRPLRAQGVVTFPSGHSLWPGAAYVGMYVLASGEAVAVGLDLGHPSITNFAEEAATAIQEQYGTRLGIDPARLTVVHYHEGHRDPVDGHRSGVLSNDIPLRLDGKAFRLRADGEWGHPSRRDLEARLGESLKPIITAALERRQFYREWPAEHVASGPAKRETPVTTPPASDGPASWMSTLSGAIRRLLSQS